MILYTHIFCFKFQIVHYLYSNLVIILKIKNSTHFIPPKIDNTSVI